MSTTFGVKIPQTNEIKEIAFRSSAGMRWLNALGQLLPDNTKVIALDNSAQSIETVGDIKKAINGYSDSGWISVKDRLPERCEPVLVCQRNLSGDFLCVGLARDFDVFTSYVWSSVLENVTHWMPLPEPPK